MQIANSHLDRYTTLNHDNTYDRFSISLLNQPLPTPNYNVPPSIIRPAPDDDDHQGTAAFISPTNDASMPSIYIDHHVLPSGVLQLTPQQTYLASQQLPSTPHYIAPSSCLVDTNTNFISGDHPQISSITNDLYHYTQYSSALYDSEPSYNMASSTILSPHRTGSTIGCSTRLADHYKMLEQCSNIDDQESVDGSLIGQFCNGTLSLQSSDGGSCRPNRIISCSLPYNSLHISPFINSTASIGSIASSAGCSYVENNINALKGITSTNTDLHVRVQTINDDFGATASSVIKLTSVAKKKARKRKRSHKNMEDMENQRMTHIAVERNRRKQMNQHLDVLKSMMPSSYIQRGDQASTVGATIRLVEELEQILQSLQLQKKLKGDFTHVEHALYFHGDAPMNGSIGLFGEESYARCQSPMVKVEVKMVSISSIIAKVLVEKRPHQLLHTLLALKLLFLKVVQLNVTTLEMTMLYSFNLEMEIKCPFQTPVELANSIHQALDLHKEEIL